MRRTQSLVLLAMLVATSRVTFGGGVPVRRAASVESLISAIAREYAPDDYALIEIGATAYLIKGASGKILRTKKITGAGGVCRHYATVRMVASDEQMRERSEGEASIWRLSRAGWREFAHASAGDWTCKDVRSIPRAVRKCLGAARCF